MPKCAKCSDIFPPDYMFDINEKDKECVFCKLGKTFVTITQDDGGDVKVTKKECSKKYKESLNKLAKSPKVAEILQKKGAEIMK